jgi:hypothetical protein
MRHFDHPVAPLLIVTVMVLGTVGFVDAGPTTEPATAPASTQPSKFQVYLASAYAYGGAPKIPGVKPLFIGYESPWNVLKGHEVRGSVGILDPGYNPRETPPRKSAVNRYDPRNCAAIARYVRAQGLDTIILDTEEPGQNPIASRVALSTRELNHIVDDLHGRGLKVGFYGSPVTAEQLAASRPLLDKTDVLCPSYYPFTRHWDLWVSAQTPRVKLLKTAFPDKPMIPFITLTGVGQSGDGEPPIPITEYIGDAAVLTEIRALKDAGADGVAIWAGFDGTANQPYGKYPGDRGWDVIKAFIAH